jgi:two-component system, NtrC family, sensor histidine kinase KinB
MREDPSQNSLSLLYEIGRQLVSTLDLKQVLSRVLISSVEYVGAERGMLIVLDEKLEPALSAVVYQGHLLTYDEDEISGILHHGLAGWVLRNREIVLVPDTSQDERWLHRPDDDREQSGSKSAICAPVIMPEDQLVGIITIVHPQPGFLTESHIRLLQAIADQAAIAIHNARIYRSLEAAHSRYRELFEDSIDPILISDMEGRITEANRMAARMSGYEVDALTRRRITELHHVDWDAAGENFVFLLSGASTIRYESELQCRGEGKTIPIEVYAHRVEIGGEGHIQWVFRDISERKELETLQEELLAMIYHDLRSPLSNVVSSLDIIKAMLPEDQMKNLEPLVNIALRSIDRVKRLANSLLDINRLESGHPITDLKEVRIQRLVEEAISLILPNAEAKNQTVKNEVPGSLPSLFLDEDMIRRVLLNLLENAVKFTPSHGVITVGGKTAAKQVTVWVADTGAGIPADARERIFDKFTRLRVENVPRGIGLGLAFCRLAIQAHGGRIWVEKNEPKGSRFLFTLPVDIQSAIQQE